MDWRGVLLVAAGGALGCVARFGVSSALVTKGFPWATLAVNLLGSLLIGYLLLDHGLDHAPRLFAVVGFLGGFTTLSTLTVQTVLEADGGRPGLAAAYVAPRDRWRRPLPLGAPFVRA